MDNIAAVIKRIQKGLIEFFRRSDMLLITLCVVASTVGILLVYSAMFSMGAGFRSILLQLGSYVAGLILALIISQFDYEDICNLWPFVGGFALLLMILTFTPLGLNATGTDDTAWLAIPLGFDTFTFQPSELLKIAFIISFSKHLTMVQDHINRLPTVLLLAAHAMAATGLVFLQGDDGTAAVFLCIFLCMMFAAGVKAVYFLFGGAAIGAAVPIIWSMMSDDKKGRFLCLVNVEEYLSTTGYQQYKALTALGSGQLFGIGYKNGSWIFGRNNDLIFTVAGQEFGFIGSVVVIALIALILTAILRNASHARDSLGSLLCVGMFSLIGFQSIINLGMNVRLLPVLGITLPFFSAGGSSVLTLFLGIGLVLSVHYSSHASSRGALFGRR